MKITWRPVDARLEAPAAYVGSLPNHPGTIALEGAAHDTIEGCARCARHDPRDRIDHGHIPPAWSHDTIEGE